jgi:hypothetical protein
METKETAFPLTEETSVKQDVLRGFSPNDQNLTAVRHALREYLDEHVNEWEHVKEDVNIIYFGVMSKPVVAWLAGRTRLSERDVQIELIRFAESRIYGVCVNDSLTTFKQSN